MPAKKIQTTETNVYRADTLEELAQAAMDCGAVPNDDLQSAMEGIPEDARYLIHTTWDNEQDGFQYAEFVAVGTITYLDENFQVIQSFTV